MKANTASASYSGSTSRCEAANWSRSAASSWKPTTTYTVIKRLSERGVLVNENSVVRSLVSKDEVQAAEIDELVEKKFGGSLPAFIAAFTRHRRLSGAELDEMQRMIDEYREGGGDG